MNIQIVLVYGITSPFYEEYIYTSYLKKFSNTSNKFKFEFEFSRFNFKNPDKRN
jgi:hypothetical protein